MATEVIGPSNFVSEFRTRDTREGVTRVATELTGVFWKPVVYILEAKAGTPNQPAKSASRMSYASIVGPSADGAARDAWRSAPRLSLGRTYVASIVSLR